jgi:peptidase M28-like protein
VAEDAREQTLRWIREVAAIERPSASAGERRAAEWVLAQLPDSVTRSRIECERAHGTHLPFVLPSALALAAGFARSRFVAVLMAGLGTAAIVDELGGHFRVMRRVWARRRAYNVIGELGDPQAARTVVFVSHHDAARPWPAAFGALVSARPPRVLRGWRPPIARTIAYAPLVVLLGVAARAGTLRRSGMALCAFIVALFGDTSRRPAVPGANDNGSGVATVLGLAREVAASGPTALRVLLLSTGSEETMLEGMEAFLRRHRNELDPSRTLVVCLDMVGWDRLIVREGEGVLRYHPSRAQDVELLLRAARSAGVDLAVAPPGPAPTDGLAARWAGLPTILVSSVAADGRYPHYHRPTDTPENVNVETVLAARRLCAGLVARLAETR